MRGTAFEKKTRPVYSSPTWTPLMQMWGPMQDPARDLGLYRPAGSTVGVVETLRSGPFGP